MSTAAHSLPLRRRPAPASVPPRLVSAPADPERKAVRILAFTALALYGVLRWEKLMTSPPTGRLLGLLAVVVALGALGPLVYTRSRALAMVAGAAAVVAAFALSGVPVGWVVHVRLGVSADGIGQGLSALPGVLIPYSGVNQWVGVVMTLGAAVLLLDAGLLLAFAPPALGDARRAAVALPLIALAVVPSTVLRPKDPYVQGLLLFALIAAFMWGERVRRKELGWVLTAGAVVAAGAMWLAPSLDPHKPWIDYRALANGLAPTKPVTFDWAQRYGRLNWPQSGREVLDVQGSQASYWKAEDLDSFNGRAWIAGGALDANPLAGLSTRVRAHWTQTVHVTLRAMSTSAVIAAGTATGAPMHIAGAVGRGASPGTWVVDTPLGPGDSYTVTTYTPRPTAVQLARAGNDYPNVQLADYRAIDLPRNGANFMPLRVVFPPFRSRLSRRTRSNLRGDQRAAIMNASPYGQAYRLARRLAARAATPYAFAAGIERYLVVQGFVYSENPPSSAYPLESFLFTTKLGYCQQFAGAMALLLRMGGVPARVAVGFTSGSYNSSTHEWVVSDVDAHAWVEAWFPHYGWVQFDPTPPGAPARGGHAPISVQAAGSAALRPPTLAVLKHNAQLGGGVATSHRHPSGSTSPLLVALAVALVAVLALGSTRARRRAPDGETLVAELERALARSGRPVSTGMTLAGLEHRLHGSAEAASYIRAIRLARFGGRDEPPSAEQRRALRAHLSAGLGFGGALRAIWALPPGWPARKRAWPVHFRGIHS